MRGVCTPTSRSRCRFFEMTCSASLSLCRRFRVKGPRGSRAGARSRIPRRATRRRPRQHRRLHQPLKVERHVISSLARAADDIGPGAQRPSFQRDDAIENRHQIQDGLVLCLDQPVDAGARQRSGSAAAAGIAWIMSPSALPGARSGHSLSGGRGARRRESVVASFWVIGGDAGEEIAGWNGSSDRRQLRSARRRRGLCLFGHRVGV